MTNSSKPKSNTVGKTPTKSQKNSNDLSAANEAKQKARWSRIKRVYGLSEEQYEELDKGHCPICLRTWGGSVRPAIDHDHIDGWVRGVVCLYCNRTRIGRFRDSALVRRIADYLDQSFKYVVPEKKKRKRKKKI